jgi:hypothetical protein
MLRDEPRRTRSVFTDSCRDRPAAFGYEQFPKPVGMPDEHGTTLHADPR